MFPFSSIFWPSSHILAFKILGLHFSAPFWVRGGLKSSSGHYKSTFRNINNLRCKKAAPAITVAFLTLMTLKLENKEICVKFRPNDQIDIEKLSKFEFSSSWPLIWPFMHDMYLAPYETNHFTVTWNCGRKWFPEVVSDLLIQVLIV